MKIAVSAGQGSLESPVDPRFGRCACFVIADSDTLEFTVVENPGAAAGMGAGIQAAQAVSDAGADAVASGNFGPNAFEALRGAGIVLHQIEPGMTVGDAVSAVARGELECLTMASVGAHFGMGGGGGMVSGGGMGMGGPGGGGGGFGGGAGGGRGRGRGRAGGGGGGMGMGMSGGSGGGRGGRRRAYVPGGPQAGTPAAAATGERDPEMEALSAQLASLQQQLDALRALVEQMRGQ